MLTSMHMHTAQRVNAAISTEHFIESNGGITDELDRKEAFIDYSWNYQDICQKGLSKTIKETTSTTPKTGQEYYHCTNLFLDMVL